MTDAFDASTAGYKAGYRDFEYCRYRGTGGRLLLLSHTLPPGDRFSYSMTLHPDGLPRRQRFAHWRSGGRR